MSMEATPPLTASVRTRADSLLRAHQLEIWQRTDRVFAGLLTAEWMAGIVWALARAPFTWEGATRSIHPHVWEAVILGAMIAIVPVILALRMAGHVMTRHVVGVSQMLSTALLIHISGGRIETHFEVFGSLAFLAFYRDWRVLVSASAVVAVDHLLRNYLAPESVFGVLAADHWRWMEHAAWVVFEDIFLIASCRQGAREMRGIAEHQALLEKSYADVEETVRERTAQLREAQSDLVKVARSAGMAEIATSVLHNVGNVLNSVNVSVRVASDKAERSPVRNLAKAVEMISAHKSDLGDFLTQDERGKRIPEFLEAVAEALCGEQTQMIAEMQSLTKNVEHIKEIVAVQQSHAKPGKVAETVCVSALLEDAITIALASAKQNNIQVVRQFSGGAEIVTDKHAVLQILVNLLSNARQAVVRNGGERRLTVAAAITGAEGHEQFRIDVTDNGEGIAAENLTRIFQHGFTTRKEGHGFGLHASANAAKRLGGRLQAASDGPGQGATFTLELPVHKEAAV